jgi:hypothetical protein
MLGEQSAQELFRRLACLITTVFVIYIYIKYTFFIVVIAVCLRSLLYSWTGGSYEKQDNKNSSDRSHRAADSGFFYF